MYTAQPKKLLILNILNILREHSSEDHRLSQKDIQELLQKEYGMQAERKSIKRNLTDLLDNGVPLEYTETVRIKKNGEEEIICTDWYIEREFSDAELRLLIDSILFSVHVPHKQKKELVKKLEGLSSEHFHSHMGHVATMPTDAPENKQLFYTIEVLDKAIAESKQVSFSYCDFGADLKLHPRLDDTGSPKISTVSPYQIAAAQGKYYLICNYSGHDNVAHVRLDHIMNITPLDAPCRPMKQVEGLGHGLDLPKHMAEHLYMFPGPSIPVTFRTKKYLIGQLVDWFGKDMKFSEETENEITVRVTVNWNAMRLWAVQYGLHVEVLTPADLRDAVMNDLKKAVENYEHKD